jgi:rhamnosyltransferase
MATRASVIVRAKNERRSIERALAALRAQTVEPEIIVVDSGSTDGTRDIAGRYCDRLIDIPPERFTFGYALNVGARTAQAPIHFALSAHCVPERRDWIERALAHYARPDVAGTQGDETLPDGTPLEGTFIEDAAFARAHPGWGFSNHASSWRASVWERFPFDERLDAAEDKEWALRVLDAGWVIAVDPALWVDLSHGWRDGLVGTYRRHKLNSRVVSEFASLPPYTARDLAREWWSERPDRRRSPWRFRLNHRRAAVLLGKWAGSRAAHR